MKKVEKQISNTNGRYPPKLMYSGRDGILFQGDCLSLLPKVEGDSVDLVFADPPFNLGKKYDNDAFNDTLGNEAYRGWCQTWLLEVIRTLRPGGSLFLYHWPKWLIELGQWLNNSNLVEYRSWIALKMKSGFPIKNRLHPAHYGILQYSKKGARPSFNIVRHRAPVCRHCGGEIRDYGGYRSKFKKYEDEDGIPWIQISDFWEDTRPARHEKARQRTVVELPVIIPERLILLASNPGDIVLDVFGGSGSTFHAARLHNRKWIGCDVGDVTSIIRRLKAVFEVEPLQCIDAKLIDCFEGGFISQELREYIDSGQYSKVKKMEASEEDVKNLRHYKSCSRIMNQKTQGRDKDDG